MPLVDFDVTKIEPFSDFCDFLLRPVVALGELRFELLSFWLSKFSPCKLSWVIYRSFSNLWTRLVYQVSRLCRREGHLRRLRRILVAWSPLLVRLFFCKTRLSSLNVSQRRFAFRRHALMGHFSVVGETLLGRSSPLASWKDLRI